MLHGRRQRRRRDERFGKSLLILGRKLEDPAFLDGHKALHSSVSDAVAPIMETPLEMSNREDNDSAIVHEIDKPEREAPDPASSIRVRDQRRCFRKFFNQRDRMRHFP